MEQALCPEHQVLAKKNQWGKYAHTVGKDAGGKSIWCNKTPEQMGVWVTAEVSSASKPIPEAQFEDSKVNSMFACNAMNNAIALVNGGKVDITKLDSAYKRILAILEGKKEPEDLDNWPDSQ